MLCLVRYSNNSFFDSVDLDPVLTICNDETINGNVTEFNRLWTDFIEDVIVAASTSSELRYYAAKVSDSIGLERVYAMMQCIPGISSTLCDFCLRQCVLEYHSGCRARRGSNIRRPACFFEWECYPYYDAFSDKKSPPPLNSQVPQPMPPLADLRNATNNDTISRRTFIAVVVIAAVIVALLALGFVFFRKRKSDKKAVDEDITSPQSLQFDFKTLNDATDKFAGKNKIGQGGFGEVYKDQPYPFINIPTTICVGSYKTRAYHVGVAYDSVERCGGCETVRRREAEIEAG
ncbi:hypothetical protein AALP_AAs50850U000500 [Arabis alpina]|uniref:Gnk2-homologous domain-containing protein n=1 Tax=Arabis alpina TaxID=50452 RepID=A0A087FZB6_ARAAL|nr:hypothetical protein AALP_AAs50850U000500 [Arabis alpina]